MPSLTPPSVSSAPQSSKMVKLPRNAIPWTRYALFFSIAIAGCAADLVTKASVFQSLGNHWVTENPSQPVWIWTKGIQLGFETHLNEGALFGMGQGQGVLFALLSVGAAIGVFLWLFFAGAARDRLLTIALACVTGGIFGNLYDRLGLSHLSWHVPYGDHVAGDPVYAVRDWIHFKIAAWNFDWPVFNIADSLLVVGACLLIWHALFCCEKPIEAATEDKS